MLQEANEDLTDNVEELTLQVEILKAELSVCLTAGHVRWRLLTLLPWGLRLAEVVAFRRARATRGNRPWSRLLLRRSSPR